ncbi:MAG TPA: hypothetical protein VL595_30800 [Pseudonocardia sp.]|jgi:hypothetical protein|nr:hypothetical protein [Pseudonocardia sp.]
MSFDGPAPVTYMSEADALAEAAAERKIEFTNKVLGIIALACLIIISLQGCLLLPLTIVLYGWQ